VITIEQTAELQLQQPDVVALEMRPANVEGRGEVSQRDLLRNTSGRYWSLDSDYNQLTHAPDRTAYAVGLTQQFPRGTTWAYNNAAIQVLDRVLRRATGRAVRAQGRPEGCGSPPRAPSSRCARACAAAPRPAAAGDGAREPRRAVPRWGPHRPP